MTAIPSRDVEARPVEGRPVEGEAPPGLTHRQIMVILSGLLLGMFLAALDQTVVSTAIRTIADNLDGQTAQAWVTTAYLITSTISTPLYGKLSDSYGRKPFYLAAIIIFLVGSMLCGAAQSIYELAAYRAIQGIGAGGLISLAIAILGDLVSARERGRYQDYFLAVFGISSVLGPILGGRWPASRRCSGSTAGAGSSTSTSRSACWRCSSSPAGSTCPASSPTSGSTSVGPRSWRPRSCRSCSSPSVGGSGGGVHRWRSGCSV